MRYDHNPELLRQLAAEYVIGTLRGAARRRFEDVLAESEEARFQRDFWEQRLAEFGQILRPVSPPVEARTQLLRRATEPTAALSTPAPRRAARHRRRRRGVWAYAAGFATAAGLVLAFLLGQRMTPGPTPGPSTPVSSTSVSAKPTAASPEDLNGWPIYAGQVRMPGSSVGWLLSLTPDHRQIIATAADDFFQAGRAELHLWCMVGGRAPIALGVLPSERDASVAFDVPASLRGQPEVVFAITLEPPGRAREGGPSAPVLSQAQTLLDSI